MQRYYAFSRTYYLHGVSVFLPRDAMQARPVSVCLSVRPSICPSHQVFKEKVKEVDLYSAFIVVPHTQGAQVRMTRCYLTSTISPAPPQKGGHLDNAIYVRPRPCRL